MLSYIFVCITQFAPKPGVHNLFAIACRITFICMNYDRQWVPDIFIFGFASVLLPHAEPSLIPHVCLAVFQPSDLLQQTKSVY